VACLAATRVPRLRPYARLWRVVPAAAYGFGTLDPATLLLTSTVCENI
jgi:hypothetical protein